jgi:hypothetical protein
MIIQTAPAGQPRLAIMMYEHTALSHQFARAFGNDRFQGAVLAAKAATACHNRTHALQQKVLREAHATGPK